MYVCMYVEATTWQQCFPCRMIYLVQVGNKYGRLNFRIWTYNLKFENFNFVQQNNLRELVFCLNVSRQEMLLPWFWALKVYIRPVLEYASNIWSPIQIGLIDKLESVQRQYIKRIYVLSQHVNGAVLGFLSPIMTTFQDMTAFRHLELAPSSVSP